MPADSKTQDKDAFLARCSPGFRAAVTGRRELPATKGKFGSVQFAAHGVSERTEAGRCIFRATIDEGQAVEIRLPRGFALVICEATPLGKAIYRRPRADKGGAK